MDFTKFLDSFCKLNEQSKYRGRVEIRGSESALSAGAYSTNLHGMVDIVRGGGRAPPTLTSLG